MKKGAILLFALFITLSISLTLSAKEGFDDQLAEKINAVVSQGPDNGHFQLDAATLAQWIKEKKNNYQVIDVRVGENSLEQYNKAHIPGALYIPYNELFESTNLRKLDKEKTIIVVCHMGATEELVIVPLRMLGYKARALLLGMSSWEKDYPTQTFVKEQMALANKGEFPTESSATYVGAKKCKACHLKQYKSWKKTTMASSFDNLKKGVKGDAKKKAGLDPDRDYTNDKECLKCHTTGYGKKDGFTSSKETPHLEGVQCEGCHGPGSNYSKYMKKNQKKWKKTGYTSEELEKQGLVIPSKDKDGCMSCHGADNPFTEKIDPTYRFDFKERLEKTHKHFPLKYKKK